jgi:hypothetical protein
MAYRWDLCKNRKISTVLLILLCAFSITLFISVIAFQINFISLAVPPAPENKEYAIKKKTVDGVSKYLHKGQQLGDLRKSNSCEEYCCTEHEVDQWKLTYHGLTSPIPHMATFTNL